MATYERTVFAKLGTTVYTFTKTCSAVMPMTGGMADQATLSRSVLAEAPMSAAMIDAFTANKASAAAAVPMTAGVTVTKGQIFVKTMLGTIGSATVSKTGSVLAVTTMTAGMAKQMEYGETMAGDYPPLEWMDDLVDAPTVTLTGSMAKAVGFPAINKTFLAATDMTGSMLPAKTIGKNTSATVVLSAGSVGTTYVPVTYEKAMLAVTVLTTVAPSADNPVGDARRSLRWINRHRRRDTW